jgi:hypothetical protein
VLIEAHRRDLVRPHLALVSEHAHAGLLSRSPALAIVVAWPAAGLPTAGILIRRRDA